MALVTMKEILQDAEKNTYCDYRMYPRYGQTPVLDKNLPYAPAVMVRPCPGKIATGVAIDPTISGNVLLGPSADNGEDKEWVRASKRQPNSCRRLPNDM